MVDRAGAVELDPKLPNHLSKVLVLAKYWRSLATQDKLLALPAAIKRPSFRILIAMDAPPRDRRDGRPEVVSRRRLLRLVGGAGLIATVGACSEYTTRANPPVTASSTAAVGPDSSPVATPPPFSDLNGVFAPDWKQPAVASPAGSPSGIWPISAPAGPGFEFIVTDQDVTPWNTKTKAILANRTLISPIGKAEKWTFNLYLPKQSLIQEWHAGVLWEFHTDSSSGHHLALDPSGTFRIGRQSAYGEVYSYTSGGPVPWDRWIPVVYEVKWSLGSEGYLRVSIDGQQYLNYSGATDFANDGEPALQFGFYSQRGAGLTNKVSFSDIRVQET